MQPVAQRVYPPNPLVQIRELEQAVRRLAEVVERRLGVARRERARVERLVDNGRSALAALDDRLAPIEARLVVVDVLPAEAAYGALIRLRQGTVAERLPLYLGNGPGQPLTKLTPTAV